MNIIKHEISVILGSILRIQGAAFEGRKDDAESRPQKTLMLSTLNQSTIKDRFMLNILNRCVFWLKGSCPFAWRIRYHQMREMSDVKRWLAEIGEGKTDEEKQIVRYLKKTPFCYHMIPYEFTKKYKPESVEVRMDITTGLKYVLMDNKRMYFPLGYPDYRIKLCYAALLLEQDAESPHRYEAGEVTVRKGDVVLDVGTAEGNFALSVVERVKKIILVEGDIKWQAPLRATFAPWAEKVTIVPKYISECSGEETAHATLDEIARNEEINFLKADIEGYELPMLRGGADFLSKARGLRLAVCTYHRKEDAEEINAFLQQYGFETSFSTGWMLFGDKLAFGLRLGVLRGKSRIV